MTTLQFLGAVGTVTGSRHLLTLEGKKYLIDCGLFQGVKANRLKNRAPFPVDPAEIDKILLTHAHIDHTGYLPRLVKQGYGNTIHGTHATMDLVRILLPDSAHLQEEDARWANKKQFSKHTPALPLYTGRDAEKVFPLLRGHYYGEEIFLEDDVRLKFKNAGHILGSAFLDIKRLDGPHSKKILFSGDFGHPQRPILRDPTQVYNVDYLILEATYGNRLHPDSDPDSYLTRIINESMQRGGVLIIPAFSVGRTQTLLYTIRLLEKARKIPELDIFVDSPMAIRALDIYNKHISELNLAARKKYMRGEAIFQPKYLKICASVEESKEINKVKKNAIIISASGMITGGRILHHLAERLPDKRNTVLFIGYQAEGTRGRAILEGRKNIKIHGNKVPVKAHIEEISGYSGHGDYLEMLAWLSAFNKAPEKTFLVHGEPDAVEAMADHIRQTLGWEVVIPEEGRAYELDF
ncbi:MAG: MBL fold metallo-hydrolase [Calditrichaeota bacterium]|nr:MAG: MBL fold metallo-hydrolase [Calditrichota bacterium]